MRARSDTTRPFPEQDQWIDEDAQTAQEPPPPTAPARRTSPPPRPRRTVPRAVTEEIAVSAGVYAGARLTHRLADAVYAYAGDRYQDALNILRPLARNVPESPAVRELLGLTLYRLGRWRAALSELEMHRQLSEESDQIPVMMDCLRALHRLDSAEELWAELRQASPAPDVVAEGRIVMAGCFADKGDIAAAIGLLERDLRVRKPRFHHLREWYALADLYERAGDIARARELFRRVEAADDGSFDTGARIRSLR